jgi:hypothetical protein
MPWSPALLCAQPLQPRAATPLHDSHAVCGSASQHDKVSLTWRAQKNIGITLMNQADMEFW